MGALKQILFIFILTVFSIHGNSQNENIVENTLRKAYQTSDSSDLYFLSAKKLLKTKADTASYFYFKFYNKYIANNRDSAQYYSDKVVPYLRDLDSLERLRKVYSESHYLKLYQGNYEDALTYNQKALSLAEKLKDTAMISLHLADISNVYHNFEDYEKGVKIGKKAYQIMNSAKEKNYKYLIFANNVIAINYDDWQKPDSALFYHYKNLELLKHVEDTLRYGFVLNNIGNTLLKQKKYSEAKKIIQRSLAINKIRNIDYNLATNYTNLATIAYHENQNALAKEYFIEANQYANKSGNIEKIRDVTQQEAWFYKKVGDYKKALELQEQFYVLRDSVFNDERAAKMAEMETKYETEKKEKQLAETHAALAEKELQVKQKDTIIYGSLGLALLLGLLGYLFYNQQKLKNRQLQKENELSNALAHIETQNMLQEQQLRISRDLHDNIGSQLTFIISSIDNLKYGLKDIGSTAINKLTSISEFTAQTIFELRDTIWAMNKSEITWEDMQVRISNFIEKAGSLSEKVSFSFIISENVSSEAKFSSIVGMNIYRIIQEAVNNALKYAEASKISVLIDKKDAVYSITIQDNGKGFDINKTEMGNGISNINKRAKNIGGIANLESIEEKGTVIKITYKS